MSKVWMDSKLQTPWSLIFVKGDNRTTMADAEQKLSLHDNEGTSTNDEILVETPGQESPDDAKSEEVVQGTPEETPSVEDNAPVSENSDSPAHEVPVGQEVEEKQEAAEEKSAIKIETAPADFRFPTTNQTRHCFTRYIEYHRCIEAMGEEASECEKFAKYYRALCPSEWVERWNEQRANGTFPGPL